MPDLDTDPEASESPLTAQPSDFLCCVALAWFLSPEESDAESTLEEAMNDRAEAEGVDVDDLTNWALEEKDRRGLKHAESEDP